MLTKLINRNYLKLIIPVSSGVFFIGLIVSSFYFYSQKEFNWTAAIISDLQSPIENPKGYLPASLGTAISVIFLVPLLISMSLKLERIKRIPAIFGTSIFGLGIIGGIIIGFLSPFPKYYEIVHIPIAFATFIFIVGGILMFLLLTSLSIYQNNKKYSFILLVLFGFKLAVFASLIYIYTIPEFFSGVNLFKTLAFWEWSLCISIVIHLQIIKSVIDKYLYVEETHA